MRLRGSAVGAALAVLLAVLAPADGWTSGIRCRSDPAVILSNGTTVDLSADIDAWLWDVRSVNYVLRVPAGLEPVLIVRTPAWPTTKETFTVIADQPAGVYRSTTTVKTLRNGTAVTVQLSAVNLSVGSLLTLASKDGVSGKPIPLSVTLR